MRALTICQPYAHEIVTGYKQSEFRTWPTTYRGYLLIHAGKSRSWMEAGDDERYPDMVFGAIVGMAFLNKCEHLDATEWAWRLTDVRRFVTPIPHKGQRGLFAIPDAVLAGIRFADEE